MCPACIANIAVITASAASTGGLTALLMKKFQTKTGWKNLTTKTNGGENETTREANRPRNRVEH